MAEEKKYTKEQITKAIKYWPRVLERINGEKDNNNTIIVEKGGKCILRTKGSRKSCLIYFD